MKDNAEQGMDLIMNFRIIAVVRGDVTDFDPDYERDVLHNPNPDEPEPNKIKKTKTLMSRRDRRVHREKLNPIFSASSVCSSERSERARNNR